MKMWMVSEGAYSDYHNVALFSTKQKAETFVALHRKATSRNVWEIEEWPVDDLPITTIRWDCRTQRDGTIYACVASDEPRKPELRQIGLDAKWFVNVSAKTKEGAIKIAAEKIAQAKADAEGIAFGMYPKS